MGSAARLGTSARRFKTCRTACRWSNQRLTLSALDFYDADQTETAVCGRIRLGATSGRHFDRMPSFQSSGLWATGSCLTIYLFSVVINGWLQSARYSLDPGSGGPAHQGRFALLQKQRTPHPLPIWTRAQQEHPHLHTFSPSHFLPAHRRPAFAEASTRHAVSPTFGRSILGRPIPRSRLVRTKHGGLALRRPTFRCLSLRCGSLRRPTLRDPVLGCATPDSLPRSYQT